MKLYNLDNVEIFRTGKWKGKTYTEADLDSIVKNFDKFSGSWFRPAVKKGHSNKVGGVAYGYINKLWRTGKTLVANLVELPEAIYNAIKAHGYDRVSIELVPEVERGGKIYNKVLWALSLLGAEVPEVDGLKPLSESLSSDIDVLELSTFLTIDGEKFTNWTEDFINALPNAAFAVCQIGTDEQGKPAKIRHLPHHNATVEFVDDNDTVDKQQLAAALYKVDSLDVPDDVRAMVRVHLESHAKELGVEIPAPQEVDMTDEEKKKFEEKEKEQADMILKLSADLAKATEEIKKLTANNDNPDAIKEIEALQAKVKSDGDKIVELQAEARKARIDAKVKELRVPALTPFVREFYELASDNTETIKFSADGKDPVDTKPEHVVDQFVNYINKATETLFDNKSIQEPFERDDTPPNENVRAEVDTKVSKYMAENKLKPEEYSTALAAVFAADPKLKEAYARS